MVVSLRIFRLKIAASATVGAFLFMAISSWASAQSLAIPTAPDVVGTVTSTVTDQLGGLPAELPSVPPVPQAPALVGTVTDQLGGLPVQLPSDLPPGLPDTGGLPIDTSPQLPSIIPGNDPSVLPGWETGTGIGEITETAPEDVLLALRDNSPRSLALFESMRLDAAVLAAIMSGGSAGGWVLHATPANNTGLLTSLNPLQAVSAILPFLGIVCAFIAISSGFIYARKIHLLGA
ncbi:MAG: hypothetical protein ACYC5F_02130 [Thermoleophilia bacterium]